MIDKAVFRKAPATPGMLKSMITLLCNSDYQFITKSDAGNPILNTLSKATSALFSACKKPTGILVLYQYCIAMIINRYFLVSCILRKWPN